MSYSKIVTTGVVISAAAASLILYDHSWTKSKSDDPEKAFIPEDIIRLEVLPRLPVKSFSRFQCVCKSWKSLNSDPLFVKSYMTYNKLIHPEDDAMILHCYNNLIRVGHNKDDEHSREMKLCGSVNGLVCMYTYINRKSAETTAAMIRLWNPFTRMYKDVVLPPSIASNYIRINDFFLALGFDPVKNDYKVIFVSRKPYWGRLVADVYSCNAGSWCNINVSSYYDSRCNSISRHDIIYANGSIYWKSDDRGVESFDIIDEVFKTFRVLEHDDDDDDFRNERRILVNLKNSIAQIIHSSSVHAAITFVDVYVLNEKFDIWSKLYKVGPISSLPGEMKSMGCFSVTGTLVFSDQKYHLKLLSIDEENQEISKNKIISILDPSQYFNCGVGKVIGYTRTLVFVKGMKPVKLDCAYSTLIIGCKGDIYS